MFLTKWLEKLIHKYNILISICLLEKVFSFLSQDEVERMRAEEDQKIASLSRSEIKSWADIDEADDDDDLETK